MTARSRQGWTTADQQEDFLGFHYTTCKSYIKRSAVSHAMRIQSKVISLWFLGIIGAGLAFCIGTDLLGLRIAKLGAQTYVLGSVVAVPVSIFLTVVELRRPQRAVGWPLVLLAVSALPPLLLLAIFWNDPD